MWTSISRVPVSHIECLENGGYRVWSNDQSYDCGKCIVSVGRSGSKWMEHICKELDIPTKSNRVDIGVRVELPRSAVLPFNRRAVRKQDRIPYREV